MEPSKVADIHADWGANDNCLQPCSSENCVNFSHFLGFSSHYKGQCSLSSFPGPAFESAQGERGRQRQVFFHFQICGSPFPSRSLSLSLESRGCSSRLSGLQLALPMLPVGLGLLVPPARGPPSRQRPRCHVRGWAARLVLFRLYLRSGWRDRLQPGHALRARVVRVRGIDWE